MTAISFQKSLVFCLSSCLCLFFFMGMEMSSSSNSHSHSSSSSSSNNNNSRRKSVCCSQSALINASVNNCSFVKTIPRALQMGLQICKLSSLNYHISIISSEIMKDSNTLIDVSKTALKSATFDARNAVFKKFHQLQKSLKKF